MCWLNGYEDSLIIHSPAVRRALWFEGLATPRCTPYVASLRTPFAWGYWRVPASGGLAFRADMIFRKATFGGLSVCAGGNTCG